MGSKWLDNGLRYGLVTRLLHWSMALLFVWQFAGKALGLVQEETPLVTFWAGTHVAIGTLLFGLVLLRAAWGLLSLRARPPHLDSLIGKLALLGHLVLYLVMLVVPALALLRQYGSGRGLSLFGLAIWPAHDTRIEWMMVPANLLHGLLGWGLLAMIAGHVAMVVVHRYVWRDDVMPRMAGSIPATQAAE